VAKGGVENMILPEEDGLALMGVLNTVDLGRCMTNSGSVTVWRPIDPFADEISGLSFSIDVMSMSCIPCFWWYES
jgi:hypothetical protein